MKRASSLGIAMCAAALSSVPAYATGMDAQSSASVRITVNIPPFAAGLAAQAEGAVGLWTMIDDQSTLMVKLPDSVSSAGGEVEAAVFTPASAPFSVSVANPGMKVASLQSTASNGLIRHGFTLRHTGFMAPAGVPPEGSATLVIAAV